LSGNQSHEEEMKGAELTLLGFLVRKALQTASHGEVLTADERNTLQQWLRGEKWFNERPSSRSEEARMIRAQIMLLGPELRKALVSAARDGQLTREDRRELHEWLYSTRRLQRRYQRRRYILYLVYTMTIFIISFLSRPLIPIRELSSNPLTIPFIVSVAILLGAIFKDVHLDRNVETALSDFRWSLDKAKEEIRDILEKDLRPRIIHLDSADKVLKAASDVLLEAVHETQEHRFVVFIGAASLSTLKFPATTSTDEDTMSPVEEYNTRLMNLEGARVPVKRYVSLVKPADFKKRKPDTRRDYLRWFEKQIGLLKDNPKYTLIDCYRAQPWGGSRSSIITHKSFLDIVGEGDSGFLITGEEVARTLKDSSERLFAAANQHAYPGDEDDSIESLEKLLGELRSKL